MDLKANINFWQEQTATTLM